MESPDHDDHGSGRTGEKPGWTGTPTPHDSDNSGVESENTSYNKNNIYKNTKGREDEGAYGTPAPVYLSPTADSVPTPHNIGYEQEKDPSVVSKSDTISEGRDIHPESPEPDDLPPPKSLQEQLTIEAIDPKGYIQRFTASTPDHVPSVGQNGFITPKNNRQVIREKEKLFGSSARNAIQRQLSG